MDELLRVSILTNLGGPPCHSRGTEVGPRETTRPIRFFEDTLLFRKVRVLLPTATVPGPKDLPRDPVHPLHRVSGPRTLVLGRLNRSDCLRPESTEDGGSTVDGSLRVFIFWLKQKSYKTSYLRFQTYFGKNTPTNR